MKSLFCFALVALGAGCATIASPVAQNAGDIGWPAARPVSEPIAIVPAPTQRHLASMEVVDLANGGSRRLEVVRYGNGVRVRESDGCVWTRDADWFSPSDSWANCGNSRNWRTAQASVTRDGSLYPLQVGSQGAYTRTATTPEGRTSTRTTSCLVTGVEAVARPGDVETPAYVVVCEDGRLRRTTWFAPQEGPVAYREEHLTRGLREAWVRKS